VETDQAVFNRLNAAMREPRDSARE